MKLDTSFPENYDLLKIYIHGNESNPTAPLEKHHVCKINI